MHTMNLNSIIFIDSYPKLDIHGYDRETGRVAINDFIKDNIKLKNNIIVIVHGKGSGILKTMTKETLKHNRYVIDHKIYNFNDGCTVVLLDLTKIKKMI